MKVAFVRGGRNSTAEELPEQSRCPAGRFPSDYRPIGTIVPPADNELRRSLPSEYEFQSQLRRARAADLVQRIEAAGLAAGAERGSEHLGGLAE